MQLTRMIERSFHADTEAECKDWIRCYREVQKKLNEEVVEPANDVNFARHVNIGAAVPCFVLGHDV